MADDDDSYRSLGDTVSDTKSQVRKGKSDRAKSGASAVGSGLRQFGQDESDRASSISQSIRPVAYKRGGKVRKSKMTRKSARKGRRSKR
jgi:hypothetical protein